MLLKTIIRIIMIAFSSCYRFKMQKTERRLQKTLILIHYFFDLLDFNYLTHQNQMEQKMHKLKQTIEEITPIKGKFLIK